MSSSTLEQKIEILQKFSPCDVSDALLKLQKGNPRAGHLADITPFSPFIGRHPNQTKIIGPASTFKFVAKDAPTPEVAAAEPEKHGFPPGKHWVDWAQPGTVVVIEQPAAQHCAVLGGIMAARMKYLGVKAAVVNGRVRDLAELHGSGLHVWARATSTVGTGAEAKPGERDVPISFGGVTVSPGDIIVADPLEGVVVIPRDLLDEVLELMPQLVEQDEKVKADVERGVEVFEAFKRHRTLK
ncbi:hypothetical protein VTN77DRAFT_6101 [Rasamsonia byssochlamydoides]|uniref:uncharacterized protein n=1 Tax=Rasamsonia byssochlamydoides TaxID=89139 RepID=UPI0037449F80